MCEEGRSYGMQSLCDRPKRRQKEYTGCWPGSEEIENRLNRMLYSHLHLVASIDNTVFILVVFASSSAVGLEGVVVDAARFLFYLHEAVPFNFNNLKFLRKAYNPEKSRCPMTAVVLEVAVGRGSRLAITSFIRDSISGQFGRWLSPNTISMR